MHHYQAYGLHFVSDLILPVEVCEASLEIDVTIHQRDFRGSEMESSFMMNDISGFQESLLLEVETVGRFMASSTEILYEKAEDVEEGVIVLYVMGSVLASLLHLRGLIPFHGSALVYEGCHLLIMGDSGAGKSSMTQCLMQRGCDFVSDDLLAFDQKCSDLRTLPAFGLAKLSRKQCGDEPFYKKVPDVFEERDKVYVKRDVLEDNLIPAVTRAVILECHSEDVLVIEAVKGARKVDLLLKQLFRTEYTRLSDTWPQAIRIAMRLASQVEVLSIKRPLLGDTKKQIEEALHQWITSERSV